MESIVPDTPSVLQQSPNTAIKPAVPYSQEWVTITKQTYIELTHQANYWQAQYAQIKQKCARLEEEVQYKQGLAKTEKLGCNTAGPMSAGTFSIPVAATSNSNPGL